MRPDPYSWKGVCPDPNYQHIIPQGVKGDLDLMYPCCRAKNIESRKQMKEYLINGFPGNKETAEKYSVTKGNDIGSGVIIPGSNEPGAISMVNIDGAWENVRVLKRLNKSANTYSVEKSDKTKVIITGDKFMRDSRVFPGLKDFSREQLLSCIMGKLRANGQVIDTTGNLVDSDISKFNEIQNDEYFGLFKTALKINPSFEYLAYTMFDLFEKEPYTVRGVPEDAVHFYLVLSPIGNFYITRGGKSIVSDISETFNEIIIMDGFLRNGDNNNEYHIIDILYLGEDLTNEPYSSRISKMLILQGSYLNNVEEIMVFPPVYDNIIEGSYSIAGNDNNVSLIFMGEKKCCRYIVWNPTYKPGDEFYLQVLKKKGTEITFSINGEPIKRGIGLDRLINYKFNSRDIPPGVVNGSYLSLKINRDSNGNIVPARIISILSILTRIPPETYDNTVKSISIKLDPVKKVLFSSPTEWYIPGKTLVYRDDLLVQDGTDLII